MGRPRRVGEAELLAAARRVFLVRGPSATTREVALAAGVSQPVLFQRYRTKEVLFFAAMLPPAPALDQLIPAPPPSGQAAAQAHVEAIAARLLEWLARTLPGGLHACLHPGFPTAMAKVHGPSTAEGVHSALALRLELLQRRGDIAPQADPHAAAAALLQLLHGRAVIRLLAGEPHEPTAGEAAEAASALWIGLKPGGDPS